MITLPLTVRCYPDTELGSFLACGLGQTIRHLEDARSSLGLPQVATSLAPRPPVVKCQRLLGIGGQEAKAKISVSHPLPVSHPNALPSSLEPSTTHFPNPTTFLTPPVLTSPFLGPFLSLTHG